MHSAVTSHAKETALLTFFDVAQFAGLALFFIVFFGRAVSLRIRRQIASITLDVRKGWGGLVEVVLFAIVNTWAVEVVLYAKHSDFLLFPAVLHTRLLNGLPSKIAGLALIVGGFFIFLRALKDLGSSWRLGVDEKQPGELVTTGVYAVSRHPIYLFFNLYFWGTFLVNGTAIFLAFALLIAVNLHLQILVEESFLLRVYGPAYREYCLRTGRYLGWRAPRRPAVEPPADSW
jgi:protein-S-isoprenylcysteine O-methyltransferase Ste14